MEESKVKAIKEKTLQETIQLIKEDMYNFIKEHNGNVDMVDVVCNFPQFPSTIRWLAISELIDEGSVERREAVWNIQPYRLFVR